MTFLSSLGLMAFHSPLRFWPFLCGERFSIKTIFFPIIYFILPKYTCSSNSCVRLLYSIPDSSSLKKTYMVIYNSWFWESNPSSILSIFASLLHSGRSWFSQPTFVGRRIQGNFYRCVLMFYITNLWQVLQDLSMAIAIQCKMCRCKTNKQRKSSGPP